MTRPLPVSSVFAAVAAVLVTALGPATPAHAQRVLIDQIVEPNATPSLESLAAPIFTPAATNAASHRVVLPTLADPGDEQGAALSAAGDINGDGYSDLILSSPGHAGGRGLVQTYLGVGGGFVLNASLTSAALSSRFGESVSTAGDVNDDGYDDIIVGWPLINSGVGQALLYHGGPTGLAGGVAATLNGTLAGGHFGACVSYAGHLNGDNYGDIAVGAPLATAPGATSESGAVYVYYGSAAGIAGAPTGFRGSALHQRRGTAIAGVGDVNADTFDDLLVGAPFTAGDGAIGRVYLYRGSNTGLLIGAVDSLSGSTANARFGFAVSPAGDWDADGYMDVAVGAPFAGGVGAEAGVAYLIRGTSTGLANSVTSLKAGQVAGNHMGWSVGCAGDVNGDGFGDVVIGEPDYDGIVGADEGRIHLRYGLRSGTALPDFVFGSDVAGAKFGFAASGIGDSNGDGFAEVAVGAPQYGGAGTLYVFEGRIATAARPTQFAYGHDAGILAGKTVAMAGDVNGDGYDDAIAGVPGDTWFVPNQGAAYIHLGQAGFDNGSSTIIIPKGTQTGGRYGESVSGAGDVNGDGYDDVIIGAPGHTATFSGQGAAFLLRGQPAGIDTIPSAQWLGASAGQAWGTCVAGAGDLNHDGYADLAVGSPLDGSLGPLRAGRVAIYLGGPSGPALTPSFEVFGQTADESLGVAIAAAGDVTGDGIDDLAIGAPGYAASTGRVRIVRGSFYPPFHVSSFASNSGAGARFGASLAGRGDVNGDGIADLAIGAPRSSVSGTDMGQVEIHLGGIGDVSPLPVATLVGRAIGDRFGTSVAWGDLSSDGFSDLAVGSPGADTTTADVGAVDLYLADKFGNLTGPITRLQRTTTFFVGRGTSVAMNGDLNGDGFADVIFGAPLSTGFGPTSGLWEFAIGGGSFSARDHVERQLQWLSATPLALGGRSTEGTSFDTVMRARTAAGREPISVEHQRGTTLQQYFALPINVSIQATFGAPDPTNGCFTDMGQGMTGFAPGDDAKWHMRVRTRFPWIPSTPWWSPSGIASTLKHVLMPPSLVAVDPADPAGVPSASLEFAPAWPNPSHAGVSFAIRLPTGARVGLSIYDVEGRLVRDLSPGTRPAGETRLVWDGTDARGEKVSGGLYFARLTAHLTAGEIVLTRQFVRI